MQHVVVTYDPTNGRRIYVNGKFTDDVDTVPGGLLTDWDNTFALALASEVDNTNRWAGTVRLVAIHNRALTADQIKQNFDVGVGEKYFLLFNVSDHVGKPDAYVVFEVSQFDSYSYLFRAPFFMMLDSTATPGDIPIAGIRIGINGREAAGRSGVQEPEHDDHRRGVHADGSAGAVVARHRGRARERSDARRVLPDVRSARQRNARRRRSSAGTAAAAARRAARSRLSAFATSRRSTRRCRT